jgi:glycosyltransferase involved in cell wall biosynthesis
MKVLLFIRALGIGGTQRQLAMLAQGLVARGHEVAIAVLYVAGEIDPALRATARIISLEKKGRWHVIGPLMRLRRLMRSQQPDIIYAFLSTQTTLAAILLPRDLQTRLVFGIRAAGMGAHFYDALSALSLWLEARLASRADLIIANSRAAQSDAVLRGMPVGRIVVIPNGIDTVAMAPLPEAGAAHRQAWGLAHDAFVIGCVARFDPMKDHASFLKAGAMFLRHHGDVRFVCIGSGPTDYITELKALGRKLGLAERIIWADTTEVTYGIYNAFDIATLTSSFGESFPNVIGEAMACGVPVVATDLGDVKEIIAECGEVVPPREPAALCAAWERLRQRLKLEPGLRARARAAIIEKYSVESMVLGTERALFSLYNQHSGATMGRTPTFPGTASSEM